MTLASPPSSTGRASHLPTGDVRRLWSFSTGCVAATSPSSSSSAQTQSPHGLRERHALRPLSITAVDQVAVGNVVIAEGTIAGTHSGTFRTPQGEIPRTGNPVSLRYAAVKRFEGDRLASEHLYFDQLEFLQQLGAMN